jgi:hypothetical protein
MRHINSHTGLLISLVLVMKFDFYYYRKALKERGKNEDSNNCFMLDAVNDRYGFFGWG